MARRWVVLVVLALAASSSSAIAAVTRVSGGTTLHLYTPFAITGLARGVSVAATKSGYCWTTSLTDPRSDAFRCFVRNAIHDPCFAKDVGSAKFVLCPNSHPGSKLLRIDLTKKLPAARNVSHPTRYPPWTVRLESGRWCEAIGGASELIAGMRVNYGCAGGGVLLGALRRNAADWTIFYASSFRSGSFTSTRIASAWW